MTSVPVKPKSEKILTARNAPPPPVPDEQLSPTARKIEAAFRAIVAGNVTVREVYIPEPNQYDARAIREFRERLGVSIAVFARLMGVSVKLVEAWEGGRRIPAPLACRLIDRIAADPERFLADLLITRKVAG